MIERPITFESNEVMNKLIVKSLFVTLALMPLSGAGAQASVVGPEAAYCGDGANGPAVLVRVDGFKARSGTLRIQVYGDNPSEFLAKGKKLKRIDLPVTQSGKMNVCVALPKTGRYAVAVRHDLDGNGKSGWSDGGGFSRNPNISLLKLKPSFEDVAIAVGPEPKALDVILNYRHGLSIGPVKSLQN